MKSILSICIIVFICACSLMKPASAQRSYWQQDVAYQMDVTLDRDSRTLLGHLKFNYRNNSPDTLSELRFHAHYNAMRPGSPTDRRWRSLGHRGMASAPPQDYASLDVHNLIDDQNRPIQPEIDYSIFRVPLHDPLPPGGELWLTMDFSSRIPGPSVGMRSAAAYGQLRVAHWYPQVCVYDPMMGWVDNQYLGWGEAYGEFGIYDVSITLPETFIVGATGVLLNRDQMLPDTLLGALDLENFKDLARESASMAVIGKPERTKTWRFLAENVHDFAFVADLRFCIDRDRCGNTDIWILARREHASGWEDAAQVTRQGMEILEREIGPFPYPEFTVVDCYSGMEYPGIVFCGGRSPSYKLLIWHEMTHNYFMGALGSNQTDRPFMDEGFTTYWEIRIMEELLGRENIHLNHWGPWKITDLDRWRRGFRPYLQWQKSSFALPLHIESDLPAVYMQYRVSAYYKPVCTLFALQYLVGEKGIRQIMNDYYDRWTFRHPYEHDFFRCAEETLGLSLEWFYDAWVRGTKSLDYSIDKVRSKSPGKAALRIRREGNMILPVKVAVEDREGDTTVYFIPLDTEPNPPDCDVRLPRWDQRRDPYPEYTFEVEKSSIKWAELDPQGLLADVNPLNNRTSVAPPTKWEFDYPLEHVSPVNAYRVCWAPTAFYNGIDGLQVGAYLKGDYLEEWSRADLALRLGALTGRVSAEVSYNDTFSPLGRGTTWGMSGYTHEGHRGGELRLEHVQKLGFDQPARWGGGIRWFVHEMFDAVYLSNPSVWEDGVLSAIDVRGTVTPGLGRTRFSASARLEVDAPGSDFEYRRSSLELSVSSPLDRSFDIGLRCFAGSASAGTPLQRWFGLGGAGPLDRSRVHWLRAWASLPPDWDARAIGDGNLSGYSSFQYLGRTVASAQATLSGDLDALENLIHDLHVPPRFQLDVKAIFFVGVGDLSSSMSSLKAGDSVREAGAGLTLEFPSGSLVELAFPLYLSQPSGGERHWAWRSVLGFSVKK